MELQREDGNAGVAELADAGDLKSGRTNFPFQSKINNLPLKVDLAAGICDVTLM